MSALSFTIRMNIGVPGTTESDQWFDVTMTNVSADPVAVPKAILIGDAMVSLENSPDQTQKELDEAQETVVEDNADVVDPDPSRFAVVRPHKLFLHAYINRLPFRTLHAIDTKHGHTKRLVNNHPVKQMGYDFGLPSTAYLAGAKQNPDDVVWLDYCCTPNHMSVRQDLKLCRTKWVFCTFSTRGVKWKSIVKRLPDQTLYRYAWHYTYTDTSHMVFVAYTVSKSPPVLVNPVGQSFKFKFKSKWYTRTCEALLCGPADDLDQVYLQFHDSNEPMTRCKLVRK